jgi:hypothetical protein
VPRSGSGSPGENRCGSGSLFSVEDFRLFAVDAVGKIFEEGIFGQLGVTVMALNDLPPKKWTGLSCF